MLRVRVVQDVNVFVAGQSTHFEAGKEYDVPPESADALILPGFAVEVPALPAPDHDDREGGEKKANGKLRKS